MAFESYTDEELSQSRAGKGRKVGGFLGFGSIPQEDYERGERNLLGNIVERPGAANRGFIRGLGPGGPSPVEGYKRGVERPHEVPHFRDIAEEKALKMSEKAPDWMMPLLRQEAPNWKAAGLAADIATNPADVLAMMIGKLPLGAGRTLAGQVGKTIGQTRPIQALGRFGTRPRYAGGPMKGEGLPTGTGMRRQWTKFKERPLSTIERTKRAVTGKKAIKAQMVVKEKEATKQALQRVDDYIQDTTKKMRADIQGASETGSLDFQQKLPEFFKRNSDAYGQAIDDIAKTLSKDPTRGVTRLDMERILQDTIVDSMEAGITSGRPYTVINNLLNNKYRVPPASTQSEAMMGGKISFDHIINDYKLIKGQISKTVKTKGFTPEDVVAEIFREKFSAHMAEQVPEFLELQKSYSTVVRAMKKSHQVFGTYKGPLETKGGTEFLKKVGKPASERGLERGERELLKILEEGSEFATGVGKISATPERLTKALDDALVKSQGAKNTITAESKARLAKADKYLDAWLATLSNIEKKALLARFKRRALLAGGGGTALWLLKRKLINPILDTMSGSGGTTQSNQGGGGF